MTNPTKDDGDAKTRARRSSAEARERAVDAREKAVQRRETAAGSDESAIVERESAAGVREESVLEREDRVRTREDAADARSERDQLIEDLKVANEKLTLLSIRSQELAEKAEESRQLIEASERELRSASEFRERLIGIVSHDLRNPLGAIWMALDVLLRDHHLDDDGRSLAHRIRRSADRMGKMIMQLLDFTRAHEGGGIPLERKPILLNDICHEVIDELELRHSMPDRFHCEFHGDMSGTWDGERLGQVISNLGANAIEHGTPGSPIHLTATGEVAEVVLEIHNQGEPIPSKLLPFIFAPFRRARLEEGPKSGGLGLGLYISDQIVRAHGGSITVRSTAAEGTTFTVRLPRRPPDGSAQ